MSNAATIIPFTTDSALSEVNKLSQLVDDLLELGAKLNNNAEQLKNVQKILRQQELKKQFLTLEEVADALHCEKKTATKTSTGIESAVIKVVKGTEGSNGNLTPPSLETGDILAGDAVDEMPLYYIYITDLSVTRVQQVFNTVHSLNSMWDYIYPVGSIYMSVNDVSPSVLFGGSWERINDRFLLAAGAKKAGTEGGKENHTLTEEELPSHTHTVPKHTHTAKTERAGLHNHGVNRCRNAASGTARFAAQFTENSVHMTTQDGEHIHNVIVDNSEEFATESAGEGKAFNIMPPYLSVYMWKRIN